MESLGDKQSELWGIGKSELVEEKLTHTASFPVR